jgi:hypothetical protein
MVPGVPFMGGRVNGMALITFGVVALGVVDLTGDLVERVGLVAMKEIIYA